jgi:crotonobetainyl-CoA:carnitine CoA-transferase CaiB-like acyl-CoA transferase
MPGPLDGLKVIELAHIMSGPTCGLMLADMGADVIKVEKVPGGDDTRRMTPPKIGEESAAFMMMNRNKRGIALDLKSEGGKEILLRLVRQSDVILENFRHDTLDRLGLGYDRLRAENPAIIYCAISGFGRTGPYATRGGFDLVAQGMSGLMSITGEGEGRPPVKVGAPVSDTTAGVLAAMGILAAYVNRLKTGEGQVVDASLFEAAIMHTYWQSAICLATGESPKPMGSAHPLNGPYQAFQTADGWVNVGGANQANWERIARTTGLPALIEDPRFRTNGDRMANLKELEQLLTAEFRKQPSAYWLARFEEEGVPAGPVMSIAEMLEDPHVAARGMVTRVDHPTVGEVKTLGLPVRFSDTPGGVARPAPLYGQHSRDVLAELGYDAGEIEHMITTGSVREG